MSKRSIQRINIILAIIASGVGIYLLFFPYIPEAQFVLENKTILGEVFKSDEKRYTQELDENWLIIPQIGLESKVLEGDVSSLNKGVWRKPESSTPEMGGNTVLIAHRFLRLNNDHSFYHLPKLNVGDRFKLVWNGKELEYEVFEKKEVFPTEVSIEENTDEPILTLYTCTPITTSHLRLVVKAKMILRS